MSHKCLEVKNKQQMKSCPSCFPCFCSRQAAQGRVCIKCWVVEFSTNCSLFLLKLKEICVGTIQVQNICLIILKTSFLLAVFPAPDQEQTVSRYWRNSWQQMKHHTALRNIPGLLALLNFKIQIKRRRLDPYLILKQLMDRSISDLDLSQG